MEKVHYVQQVVTVDVVQFKSKGVKKTMKILTFEYNEFFDEFRHGYLGLIIPTTQ